MGTESTLFQNGAVRAYREDDTSDIDVDRVLLNNGDGLIPTELCGNRNSYRQSDGTSLVVRRIVRGDGANTVLADAGSLAGVQNILGMVVATDGTDARIATSGSIIDGFSGLTKHARYYLGSSGQISTTPGTIAVEIGVAVSTTELLLQLSRCVCVSELALEKCFSSTLFDCEEGAEYTLYGSTPGSKIPALEFKAGVDNYWYCGFPTPNNMDTTQAAELELVMAAPGSFAAVLTQWQLSYRSVLAAQHLFSGGLSTVLPPETVMPAAQHTLVRLVYEVPANTLQVDGMNRQSLARQGTIDTYLGSMNLIAATFRYACL